MCSEQHTRYFLPTLEIKGCNVMIDGRNVFDQPVKNDVRTYKVIRKTGTWEIDCYKARCFLDYLISKNTIG